MVSILIYSARAFSRYNRFLCAIDICRSIPRAIPKHKTWLLPSRRLFRSVLLWSYLVQFSTSRGSDGIYPYLLGENFLPVQSVFVCG